METRWFRRLGPGVAALAAVAAVASTTAGAPQPTWDPPACPGRPSVLDGPIGAWFRMDPTLLAGTYVGQRLTLGRADGSTWQMALDAESFAAEPIGGTVLVGSDDGRASRLSLLDLEAGCRWTVAASRDVVRGAVMHVDGRSIVESRVDRRTRADLGVWRRPLDDGEPTRLLPPISPDMRFGPTWITQLDWSEDGSSLVVASCGEVACRFRVLAVAAGSAATTVADPTFGSLVGLIDGRIVAREACRGLPCPLVSLDVSSGDRVVLDPGARTAVMARDEVGRWVVVHETVAGALRSVGPDGADARLLPAAPDGLSLVPSAAWSGSAAEHPADQLLFGTDGRLPLDGPHPARLRSIAADRTVSLSEVTR